MRAFIIGEDRKEAYTKGLPEQVLKEADLFIGVQEDDDPVGIAVFRAEDSIFRLLWIYVREEYRRRGAGTLLLKTAREILRDAGADRLQAVYTLDASTEGLHDFLEEQGMGEVPEEEYPILEFAFGDIPASQRGRSAEGCEKLSEVSGHRFAYYVSEYYRSAEAKGDPILEIKEKDYYDPDLSMVMSDAKRNITAALLITRSDDGLVLEHLGRVGEKSGAELLSLLHGAIAVGEEKLSADAKLRFCAVDERVAELARSLSGDRAVQTAVSVSQVYDF